MTDELARMLHARANAGSEPLTKKLLFSANCNDTPVVSSIVDASLSTLREARDVRIVSPDGAVRRSAKQFGWDDRIELLPQPDFFSVLGKRAA